MISPVKYELEIEEDKDFYPIMENVKTHKVCTEIIPFNTKRKVFSDLKGAFLHKSRRRNLYVMVIYGFGSNAIISDPIKNRQAVTTCNLFIKMYNILKLRRKNHKVYIMYNECSSELK